MEMYRKLEPNETVSFLDEVKNQFPPFNWTVYHGYQGKFAGDCFGCITEEKREFRRPINSDGSDQ